jgi:hypothetical protein
MSFPTDAELNEEIAITDVTGREPPLLVTSSGTEAVVKFNSFRQLRVSTIGAFSSVTSITLARDGSQQLCGG